MIKRAVLVESEPNTKITPITEGMSKGQRKNALRKNSIAFYHRFYVPVTLDGETFYTVKIVAEENKKYITLNPKKVDLYEVATEPKRAGQIPPTSPKGHSSDSENAISDSHFVSLRDLLRNVYDSKWNLYIQADEIRKKHINKKDWMKALNGKKTNLTEDQWCMVRTDAFVERPSKNGASFNAKPVAFSRSLFMDFIPNIKEGQ